MENMEQNIIFKFALEQEDVKQNCLKKYSIENPQHYPKIEEKASKKSI